jgi:hypothetical protein
MNGIEITQIFILSVTALVIVYDFFALFRLGGQAATISARIWEWSEKYPMIPFGAGIVCGHLFWQASP